ncbi:MAG: GAF domain-containing protein [Bdellovibrionia bacterium]
MNLQEKERSDRALRELLAEVELVASRISFLSEVSQSLVGALNNHKCFHQLLGVVVPKIADWGLLVLVDKDGKAERIVSAHRDPSKGLTLARLEKAFTPSFDDPLGPGFTIRHGRTELIAEFGKDFEERIKQIRSPEVATVFQALGAKSMLSVPLRANGQIFGAFWLVNAENGRAFSDDDVKLAEDVSSRASGVAFHVLEYFRTTEELKKLRIQLELREQLLSQARHDVRSILTAALLSAQLIDRTEGEQKHKLSERIIKAIRRSTEILDSTKAAGERGDFAA